MHSKRDGKVPGGYVQCVWANVTTASCIRTSPGSGYEGQDELCSDVLASNKTHVDLMASTEIFLSVPLKQKQDKDEFLDWLKEESKDTPILNRAQRSEHNQERKAMIAGIIVFWRSQSLIQHIFDPDGLKAFRAFLASELAVENLDFLVAVLKWEQLCSQKRDCDLEVLKKNMKLIISCWIDPTSPYAINISDKHRAKFEEDLAKGQVDRTIFDGMKENVLFMMSDAYTRYPLSSNFTQYVEEKIKNPASLLSPEKFQVAIRSASFSDDPLLTHFKLK